jgi:hypothetical protein
MTKLTHHILQVSTRPQYAKVDKEPRGIKKLWFLSEGKPMGEYFPKDAQLFLSERHKGQKLDDFIFNPFEWLIVSEKAWAVLEKEPVRFERFPVTLFDHKKNVLSRDYCVAHLLGTADCVDLERSKYEWDSMDPEEVHTFEKLVLDPRRIPEEETLFRIKEQPSSLIIRSDLVERLEDAGVSGFELWKLNAPIML